MGTGHNPIIPSDVKEMAHGLAAQLVDFDLSEAIIGTIGGLIAFGMTAERTRCADMAQPVSSELATRIWGATA